MISEKVLTAVFFLERTWPIQLIKNGVAEKTILAAINGLSREEFDEVCYYEKHGTFLRG